MGEWDQEKKDVLVCAKWMSELLEKVSKIYYAALITGREIVTLPEKTIDYFNKMRKSS